MLKGNLRSGQECSHRRATHRWKQTHRAARPRFLAGRADVDPRDYPSTCERCDLQALCRIHENRDLARIDDDASEEERDE